MLIRDGSFSNGELIINKAELACDEVNVGPGKPSDLTYIKKVRPTVYVIHDGYSEISDRDVIFW